MASDTAEMFSSRTLPELLIYTTVLIYSHNYAFLQNLSTVKPAIMFDSRDGDTIKKYEVFYFIFDVHIAMRITLYYFVRVVMCFRPHPFNEDLSIS